MKAALTQEEVEARLSKKNLKLLGEYVNSRTPARVKCLVCSHVWVSSKLDTQIGGKRRSGCPKCKTSRQVITKGDIEPQLEKNGLRLLSRYTDPFCQIRVQCLECGHIRLIQARTAYKGLSSCPECRKDESHKRVDRQLAKCNLELVSSFDCVLCPAKVRCKTCLYTWKVSILNTVLVARTSNLCKKCRIASSAKKVIPRLERKGLRLLEDFKRTNEKAKIECLKCHFVWKPIIADVLRTGGHYGCPVCADDEKRLDSKVIERHLLSRKIFLLSPYTASYKKHVFECLKCHTKWESIFKNVWRGVVKCPTCFPPSYVSEQKTRKIIERVTGYEFPPANSLNWLKGRNGRYLRLDGYCSELKSERFPNGTAIENQGYQHYNPSHWNGFSKEAFLEQKKRDMRKRVQCIRHGVLLICVPYWMTEEKVKSFIRTKLRNGGFNDTSRQTLPKGKTPTMLH